MMPGWVTGRGPSVHGWPGCWRRGWWTGSSMSGPRRSRLAAKPVIDLMASVTDPDAVAGQAGERLAADGWCYVPPELDSGGSWRRFFVKPDASGQRRVAHLHVIRAGHRRWTEQIAFRDALRADDDLARRYEGLKRRLAAQHADDREAYTAAKAEFIADALGRGAG